jgi:hypothetical protein
MRDIGIENVDIILLEACPCGSYEEQRVHERRWKDHLQPSLNTRNPYATRADQLRQKNESYARNKDKETYIKKRSDFRQANQDRLNAASNAYYHANKDSILAKEREKRREAGAKPVVRYNDGEREAARKASQKAYRERNTALVAARRRAWYEKNREHCKEYKPKRNPKESD